MPEPFRADRARRPAFPPAAACAALALTLAACQDPSGVGLGLIDEELGNPDVVVVASDSFGVDSADRDVTGGFGDGTAPIQQRVLAGRAQDALYGDVAAQAYFDVGDPVAALPDGFVGAALATATLRLYRDYVYGDSTASVPLALSSVVGDWNPVGATNDTTFAVGAEIARYTVRAADTLATLALPQAWLRQNEAALDSVLSGSEAGLRAFDGFRLAVPDGAAANAVLGFQTVRPVSGQAQVRSVLRLTTAADTVDLPLREVFSNLARTAPASPPNRAVLYADRADALFLDVDLVGLDTLALAGGAFELSVDAASLRGGTFARPLPAELALYGRSSASAARVLLATATYDARRGAYRFVDADLTLALGAAVRGAPVYARYEVLFFNPSAALDVLPVITGPAPAAGAAEVRPRVRLTAVPIAS